MKKSVSSTSFSRTSTSKSAAAAKKRAMKSISNLEMEDDEEFTTTDEERDTAAIAVKYIEPNNSQQMEEQMENDINEESGEEEEESDDADEDEEEEPQEMLARTRMRRPNAGRRMAELMAQQLQAASETDDAFYGNAYGGFGEADQDDDFESPPHSSDEEDEVDSDFDRAEDEDIEANGGSVSAAVEEDPERAERRTRRLKQKRLLERNKNWAIARINKMAVPENTVDPKTQRQRLEEAKKTAELNIASLKRFEDLELERKKRHHKPAQRCELIGPRVRELWTSDGRHLITLPELPPPELHFPKPKPREFRICAVSGRPARYIDPVTRLPYADKHAFLVLRSKYAQFLQAEQRATAVAAAIVNDCKQSSVTTPPSSEPQPTPAKQRKLLAAEEPLVSIHHKRRL